MTNNYANLFPEKLNFNPLKHVKKTVFIIDKLLIGIRYNKCKEATFQQEVTNVFRKTGIKFEIFTNAKAFKNKFERRMYIDVGPESSGAILYGKKPHMTHIDSIIALRDASVGLLQKMEKCLNSIKGIKYWLTLVEFTFDFIMKEDLYRKQMQDLMKQTLNLKWGRIGFVKGSDDSYTAYMNSRTSTKQTKLYLKPDVMVDNALKEVCRFEFSVDKKKCERLGLFCINDILKYDLSLLDEIDFYRVNPQKLSSSLVDIITSHYYSKRIYKTIRKKGFHAASVLSKQVEPKKWKRIRVCKNSCKYFGANGCRTAERVRNARSRRTVFEAIDECRFAKPPLFTEWYCERLNEFDPLKRRMKKAFERWKAT